MAQSDWVAEARSNEWWQEQESQKVIDIIEGLVDGNLEPTAAAEEAAATYEALVKENPPVAVAAVHNILFRAARAVGQDVGTSQRLTEFVLALQKVGDVQDSSGQTIKLNGQAVWSDLPEFSYHFREFGITIEHPDDYDGNWLDEAPHLLNATTFGAVFMEASDPVRMSFLASSSLIDGVEMAYSQEQADRAAMYIPSATAWILHAGESLYKLCQDRYSKSATLGVKESGCQWLWTGGVGFSPERWGFWKKRLQELGGQESLDQSLKSLANEALKKMQDIEA
ncbi:hypothetical protein KJ359_006592 [Pestalotiopsis sp. 9143b]|nr:hypothetical protein KJ359_006592 [Pestalotiopsis sp. 9143b]